MQQTFLKNTVDSNRTDGYWLEAFPFRVDDTCGQNLVGYGLGTSQQASRIEMFRNPYKNDHGCVLSTVPRSRVTQTKIVTTRSIGHQDWPKTQIAELQFPVAFR